MMSKEEQIVAKALALFNEKGIEYVGMRELAAELNTKLGNITYYFPTKEDLILRVSASLSEANSNILQVDASITMKSYLEMTHRHFECQYQFRCVFLSFVHLKKQYPKLSARYKKTEDQRKKTTVSNIDYLVQNKYLRKLTYHESDFLLSAISLLSRFWISEAAISFSSLKPTEQIKHYISIFAHLLFPYCTAKGRKDLFEILDK